jgi:hypothetical protein
VIAEAIVDRLIHPCQQIIVNEKRRIGKKIKEKKGRLSSLRSDRVVP